MEYDTKQRRTNDGKSTSSELHLDCHGHDQNIYWGIRCRTCRELVALDICPFVSFGPGAAGMKPGAIRCAYGHNHIYFPRDFAFIEVTVPVTEATMRENREEYRAINPSTPTSLHNQ